MCLYDVLKYVDIINPNQNKSRVVVDACIAEEIQQLNNIGIVTLGCCCGHGEAGKITIHENGLGKWKEHSSPPHCLINSKSVDLAKDQGYRPFPYYYSDGEHFDTWQIYLKTGCITEDDCKEWHMLNELPFEKRLGVIEQK